MNYLYNLDYITYRNRLYLLEFTVINLQSENLKLNIFRIITLLCTSSWFTFLVFNKCLTILFPQSVVENVKPSLSFCPFLHPLKYHQFSLD